MKLSLNMESVQALRTLADQLPKVADDLDEATKKMNSVLNSVRGELGVHEEAFSLMVAKMTDIIKVVNAAVPLATRMRETADNIEAYVHESPTEDTWSISGGGYDTSPREDKLFFFYQDLSSRIGESIGKEISVDLNALVDSMKDFPLSEIEAVEAYAEGVYRASGKNLQDDLKDQFDKEYKGKNGRTAEVFFKACFQAAVSGDTDKLDSFKKIMPNTYQVFVDMLTPDVLVNQLEYSVKGDINKYRKKNPELEYVYSGTPRKLSETEQTWHYDSMVGGEVFNSPIITGLSLDCNQGKAWIPSKNSYYKGTCGLVSTMNVLRLSGVNVNDQAIVEYAATHHLCMNAGKYAGNLGGTTCFDRKALLDKFGIVSEVCKISSKDSFSSRLGGWVSEGRGVILSVDANKLWGMEDDAIGWHAITVTSAVKSGAEYTGFFVCDSGSGCNDYAKFYTAEELSKAFFVESGDGYFSKAVNVTEIIR